MIPPDTRPDMILRRIAGRGDDTKLAYIGEGFNATTFRAVVESSSRHPRGDISNEWSRDEYEPTVHASAIGLSPLRHTPQGKAPEGMCNCPARLHGHGFHMPHCASLAAKKPKDDTAGLWPIRVRLNGGTDQAAAEATDATLRSLPGALTCLKRNGPHVAFMADGCALILTNHPRFVCWAIVRQGYVAELCDADLYAAPPKQEISAPPVA